jgi:nucleoid-associated protein YgaU
VKGDYLKKIAKTLLGNESLWKSIYEANKDVIKNPDVIYPGMTLVVPTTN